MPWYYGNRITYYLTVILNTRDCTARPTTSGPINDGRLQYNTNIIYSKVSFMLYDGESPDKMRVRSANQDCCKCCGCTEDTEKQIYFIILSLTQWFFRKMYVYGKTIVYTGLMSLLQYNITAFLWTIILYFLLDNIILYSINFIVIIIVHGFYL